MYRIFVFAAVCAFFSLALHAQENPLLRQLIDLPAPPAVSSASPNVVFDTTPARPDDFYKKENAPPDDAPLEDVFDYWKYHAAVLYGTDKYPKVSVGNAERLLEKFESAPEDLKDFLNIMPAETAIAGKIKNIFDASQNAPNIDDGWRTWTKNWLEYNSKFFIDELISKASAAKDQEQYGSVDKEDELTALTKLEWESAEPILKRLENDSANPRSKALAKTLLYKNALAANDASNIEKYRDELKEILTDKNLPARARDTAADALFETNWQGQDDFYLSLMEDKTLFQATEGGTLFSTLETLPEKNPAKWIPIMTRLIGSKNREVHNAAVSNLINFETKESLAPLLPWLSDPDWAEIRWTPGGRGSLVQLVSEFDIKESVPGLIWIVENDDEEMNWALDSLETFKDSRAVPALRNALGRTKDEDVRTKIIEALLACDGLSGEEQLSALEAYAEFIVKPENAEKIAVSKYSSEVNLPVVISIGRFLAEQNKPDENLILLTIERLKILEKEKPEAAKILSGIMAKWKGKTVDLEILRKISGAETDVETVVGALARRKELKQNVLNDVYAMRGKIGLPGAIAACILEDENDILSAFASQNAEMKIGAIACARLLRKPLPVREVGLLLDSSDKLLALAAERYLESEDSPEARRLVLLKHPNEALILGARNSFNPSKTPIPDNMPLNELFMSVGAYFADYDYAYIEKVETKLQKELIENPELTQIYALLPNWESYQKIIRVYKNKVVFTFYDDAARFRERVLTEKEIELLQKTMSQSTIENSPPIYSSCHHNCSTSEYVRLDRSGGRRVYSTTGSEVPEPLKTVAEMFGNFSENGEFKTHYNLSNKIKGLELLLADKKIRPTAIWKNGDDFRILVSDEERKAQIEEEINNQNSADYANKDLDYETRRKNAFQRQVDRAFESYEWRDFKGEKFGAKIEEPSEVPFLRDKLMFPPVQGLQNNNGIWQSKSGYFEFRAGEYNEDGLWKTNRSQQIKFKTGNYANPFISGNYVVAAKTDSDWAVPNYVVRINLQTGQETKINLPPAEDFYPVAVASSQNKILLYREAETDSGKTIEHFLLDAATGKIEPVKGEFLPLKQQTFRSLQPTGNRDEFWAAIYDAKKNQTVVGRYDAKNFAIKPVLTVPEISLNSMQIWVDEKARKVYFIYQANYYGESHILSLPLNAEKQ